MDCLDNFVNRFQKTWFCDDLVTNILKDIIENPEKYERTPVIFVGEKSPLDYCAISLRGILNNRGIGGVNVGTADELNGNGIFFNVDDYLRQRFAAQDCASDTPLPSTGNPPRLKYPYFLDDEAARTPSFSSEPWELK